MVTSLTFPQNTATNTISGTSMASPHIAGIMASFLSRKKWRGLEPRDFKAKLVAKATNGTLDLGYIPAPAMDKTPNLLVFTNPPKSDNDEDDSNEDDKEGGDDSESKEDDKYGEL